MKVIQSKITGYAFELVRVMNEKGLRDSDIVRAGLLAYAEKVLTEEERQKAFNRAKSNIEREAYEKMKKEMEL